MANKQVAHWPPLFLAIIENDNQRADLLNHDAVPFAEWKRLKEERDRFRIAAQRLLKWNPNGGTRGAIKT